MGGVGVVVVIALEEQGNLRGTLTLGFPGPEVAQLLPTVGLAWPSVGVGTASVTSFLLSGPSQSPSPQDRKGKANF